MAISMSADSLAQPCTQPFLVLGNPENRRIHFFQGALRSAGYSEARVIDYETVVGHISEGKPLQELGIPESASGAVVRIESPGENHRVADSLIRLGAVITGADLNQVERRLQSALHGEILFQDFWFAGYSHLLDRLASLSAEWMNSPEEIRLMFDKAVTNDRLSASEVPMPEHLGSVTTYEELRAVMKRVGISRVFVKLVGGSSASGVIALQTRPGRIEAVTSTEVVFDANTGESRLFNSLRLQRYSNEVELARLVDSLGKNGLTVERWLPKAGFDGRTFDLRLVVIGGEVRHTVMRTSRSPLTNLHLGNKRGDVDRLFSLIQPDSLEAAFDSCRRAAKAFPNSLYLGIDLMFTPRFQNHAVLEVNAFGDLLPGVKHEGETTYEAEVAALTKIIQ